MLKKLIYIGPKQLSSPSDPFTYTVKQQISLLFADSTKLLLRRNTLNANNILKEFLHQNTKGQLVLLQAFRNFNKYQTYKIIFLVNAIKIFDLNQQGQQRSIIDFYQLFKLLCSDFPKELIYQTLRIIKGYEKGSQQIFLDKKICCKQFIRGLFLHLIYQQFLIFITKVTPISLCQLYKLIKEFSFNSKSPKLPFHIIVNAFIGFVDIQGHNIIMVNQDSIQQYLDSKEVGYEQFVKKLLLNNQLIQFIQIRLQQSQQQQRRLNEINKILLDKLSNQQSNTQLKKKKSSKK